MQKFRCFLFILATSFVVAAVSSTGLVSVSLAAVATCSSIAVDSDGDGWGWENNMGCRMSSEGQGAHPVCQNADSDSDGDGWGWENSRSCIVFAGGTSSGAGAMHPQCIDASSDSDGDGWGWENNMSCRVAETATGGDADPPACGSADSDPDGDGWGWENEMSCVVVDYPPTGGSDSLPYYSNWPVIESSIEADPSMEAEIARIVSLMTLEEKVGQMIQPNLDQVTPAEAAEYKLGSLLNGGGSWPNNDKHASAADWANTAQAYWQAVDEAWQGRGFKIPFMWATDAVHGHNNVFGATVFPHNIGLGAANDAELIFRIGQATAREVTATGLDWTFAPTVAAPRDLRWGRTYEGYSEDPQIIYQYAGRMVAGLQGGAEGLKTDTQVISNVKHWVGDGGTSKGVDRGENHYREDSLRNLHAAGYFSGLNAGAQIVMSSFNSWHNVANYDQTGTGDYNGKVHGSKYLITDVLKGQMGFDGAVITDWNGQGEINGCSAADCPAAVNAGNDIFMVTARVDWQAFYTNLIDQVNDGTVSMERIDDAVTRILRVKMRANLWDKPAPAERTLAGEQAVLGSDEHRALAREAVQKSLVLLKNNGVLPLVVDQPVYLAGSAADDIQKQTGGWSLTWQGNQNTLLDFPSASTLQSALESLIGSDNVRTDTSTATEGAVAIVAMGEDPYAEFQGDIKDHQTLGYAQLKSTYAADLETIRDLKSRGMKVISVFFSGRPMYVNEEINLSDAFVAAWLPGTEAAGITDVLYAVGGVDFTGKLSFSWPNTLCSTAINRIPVHIPRYVAPAVEQSVEGEHAPLFAYGYGLSYAGGVAPTVDLDSLPLDSREFGCGQSAPDTGVATLPLEVYGRNADGEFKLRISGAANGWAAIEVPTEQPIDQGDVATTPINYQGQYDAVHVQFDGGGLAQIYTQYEDELGRDHYAFLNAESTLQFDIRMQQLPSSDFILAQHCVWPCLGDMRLNEFLPAVSEQWSTMKIPLECFAEDGMDYASLNTAFLLLTDSVAEFDLGNIRLVPKSLDAAVDAPSCSQLLGGGIEPLDEAVSSIFGSDVWNAELALFTAQTGSDWSPVPDYIALSVSGEGDETEVTVEYSVDRVESDKGLVLVTGNMQDLSNYVAEGSLEFELFVDSYGVNTDGLVIKMEGDTTGPDYFLGDAEALPAGEWHSISVAIADLGLTETQIQQIKTPFAILPAWGQDQRGVKFRFRNLRIVNGGQQPPIDSAVVNINSAFKMEAVARYSIDAQVQALNSAAVSTSAKAIDGDSSVLLSHDGLDWGGVFSTFDTGIDISDFTVVSVALADVPADVAYFEFKLESSAAAAFVNLLAYPPMADGEWNRYQVPLSDFVGIDPTNIMAIGFWHPFNDAEFGSPNGSFVAADILIDAIGFE